MSSRLVERSASFLADRFSRRGFLIRTAVVGSALAVSPARWILRPGTAYAAVCGPGSSCGSGWTAMCCTISGANRCPSGSIPAGWWKADNSGYCCGNTARYYIDCNMVCRCGCSGGSFCRSSCVDCSCHCASGTCDQRRVCCNYFRYGQCHQEVGCVGPILCRVVTCVPPWQLDPACGTTSATDNATAQHTAPCLDGPCRSEIDRHWQALGGAASFLGSPISAEQTAPDGSGRFRHYRGGSIYWSPATGAHEIHGAIRDRWAALGWERSVLGYPVTDERPTPDGVGRFNHFQGGSIYWSPPTGAHEIHGDIRAKWSALGWEQSLLGYPVGGVTIAPDGLGRFSQFERGSIYWSPGTGAWEVHGDIRHKWAALGWERSLLGYPVSDVRTTPDGRGRYSVFERGSIYWTLATGAREVHGDILAKWAALGAERGILGYPVTDVGRTADGAARYSRFTGGSIYWSRGTGAHELHDAIEQRYRQEGGSQSAIGLPVTDVLLVPQGLRSYFAGGVIDLDRETGETRVVLGRVGDGASR